MPYPYKFPNASGEFQATIPAPSSSLCGNFINALLKLPLLIYNFVSTVIDTGGNITGPFLSMIFTPGQIKFSACVINSPYWVLCDGAQYARTLYPDLFAAIGTIYNSQTNPNLVDGSGNVLPAPSVAGTNFRVPDFRALIPIGTGALQSGTSVGVGSTGGEEKHILLTGEDVPHQHSLYHSNSAQAGVDNGGASTTDLSTTTRDRTPTLITQPAGGGASSSGSKGAVTFTNPNDNTVSYLAAKAHNNMPPYVGVYVYIFVGVPVP